jgi:hypothetical protein
VLLTAVAAVRGPQYAGMAYQRGRIIGHQRTDVDPDGHDQVAFT